MISNNIKSKIIPEEMKKKIDEILESQLFNANRYYAESNSDIFRLMQEEIEKSPINFLNELKKRWNWHNTFYENLLEPAYLELITENERELTPKQIEILIEVYKTCCLIDEATLVTSGAIKKYLQKQMSNIFIECEDVKKEDAMFMLLTPPVDSFFVQYQVDHLFYIFLLKTSSNKALKFKEYLMKQYHANDETIFQSRFNNSFSSKLNCSADELLSTISSYRISNDYKTKHLYFTIEHPIRKAFRDIIIYDNVDEKLISSQLIGISGFLIRKQVLKYLNESGKLKNGGYIYEFSNDEVISALYELLEERKSVMEKNIRPYKQRGMTCAIACMLMALEYYKIIPKANWQYEQKYFKSYHSNFMDGAPFSALAWHFAKNGLNTEIIHSEKHIFNNSNNVISTNIFDKAMEEYKRFLVEAEEKGARILNGVDINCDMLKERLEEGKIVILAGQNQDYLHAILLCGYENENFIVCDPLHKQKQIKTYSEIENFMNTSIGRWCVTVDEARKNKEKLTSNLDKFQKEAQEKLHIFDEKEIQIEKNNAPQPTKMLKNR